MSRIQIPAEERRLADVRDHVERACRRAGFGVRETANVRLAVEEICNEQIHRRPDAGLWVEASTRGANLEIRIGRVRHAAADAPAAAAEAAGEGAGTLLDTGNLWFGRVVDAVERVEGPEGEEVRLRKRLPSARSGLTGALRSKYGWRSAGLLAVVVTLGCVPLWIHEGRRQMRLERAALEALAFGLAENARPVLRGREELSPEQTRLFESVRTLRQRRGDVLAVSIVDAAGVIWAADRTAATFTKFVEPRGLGRPDARGVRFGRVHLESEPVVHLAVPVRGPDPKGRLLGAVHLSVRWGAVESAIRAARLRMLAVAAVLYVVATLAVAGLLAAAQRPIQRLVDSLRSGNDAALALEGSDEVGAIAAAFSELRQRVDEAREDVAEHEVLQEDLVLAREIQQRILPQAPPVLPGFEIARYYRPARDVGGDYYDFLDVDGRLEGIVVADVAGKGVPGSMVMGMLRTALRMEARNNTNAGDVLARMNAFLSADMREGMFVTMFYVILDPQHRVVSYASAGHNPMVLYRAASRETFFLNPRGFPVGLTDGEAFGRGLDVERLLLHEGDVLVLYTDGIPEAVDAAGNAYGDERFLEVIRTHGHRSAEELVAAIERDLDAFRGAAPASDDVTVVVVRDAGAPAATVGDVRQRLIELVDQRGMAVADACRELGVSPSTYYRLRREAPAPVAAGPPAAAAAALPSPEPGAARAPAPAVDGSGFETPTLRGEARNAPEGVGLLALEGTGDSRSCRELEGFLAATAAERTRLVVDLGGVTYLSSRAWGLLAAQARALQERGGALVLCGMSTDLEDVFRTLGLDAVVPTAADADAALALESPTLEARGNAGELPEPAATAMHAAALAAPDIAQARTVLRPTHERGGPARAARPSSREMAVPSPEQVAGLQRQWPSLSVEAGTVGPRGEVVVLALTGVLDTVSARRFEEVLHAAWEMDYHRLVIDLSRTEFISSAGWGSFTIHLKERREQGGDLKLFGMGPELDKIHRLLGLDAILESYDVLAEALEAFGIRGREDSAASPDDAPADLDPDVDGELVLDPADAAALDAAVHGASGVLPGRLRRTRLPAAEFDKDREVRGEWQLYLDLLRSAGEED